MQIHNTDQYLFWLIVLPFWQWKENKNYLFYENAFKELLKI